jgi:hypothetical protein
MFVLTSVSGVCAEATELRKWEVGPFVTWTTFGTAISAGSISGGYGGRFTANLHPNVAVEYQMAHFPSSPEEQVQGSGHLKVTYRKEASLKLNLFGIIGPGFLRESFHLSRGETREINSIALNYGAGLEIVPHPRASVRLDFTDFYAPSAPLSEHHLDTKIAVMFRF